MQAAKWTPERIQALRKQYQLDQRSFALVLGADRQQTISDWEGGKYEVSRAYSLLLDAAEGFLFGAFYDEAGKDPEKFRAILEAKFGCKMRAPAFNRGRGGKEKYEIRARKAIESRESQSRRMGTKRAR